MADFDDDNRGLPKSLKVFLAAIGAILVAVIALHLSGHGFHGH